ncbi:FUSC family protein [Streptomyces spinoverrucosus]|uniref:FUSC family protein n=1 Tax=Streptomyces spinoverrucosus TaxID=284043 RepID=A0A4Y3VJ91_9ACTN|nr:FUSC family protein [Streptomyces spinoverrucosus]GEC05096.1 FUSC family protein [Streptomyces spinoverrucosus]GHB71864.1 FUSC family protein [Streptomyces spinoverrucosus]
MSSATPTSRIPRVHRLPLAGVLRVGRPSDIWFKPALSVVVALAPPNLTLLAMDRLDLAMYTMAGSLCALYAHNRPYAARARVLAWVVLGMLGGLAVALVTASLTTNAVVLVTVGALLAAVQKVLCDASRLGPPGNVVLTFVSSAALFAPQSLGQVPGHLTLGIAAGGWAWLVGMAPGLVRPHGPERRATAQALNAAAAYADTRGTGDGHARARAAAATAVQAAWQSLLSAGDRSTTRRALRALVVRAEVALAAPADTDPARLRAWGRELRGTGPVPYAGDPDVDELLGVDVELAAPHRPLRRALASLGPIAARTALGCALAGYASLALGIGRPYWALVTAAALYQANITLTWSRGVQRVVGNLAGVLVFAALTPLAHLGQAALVLCCLACSFGAEALISRNYWLGSVCVTPMALLITECTGFQDPGVLIAERVVDTFVGALVGFVAAVAVTNRSAGARLEHALTAVERARERTARLLAEPQPAADALEAARRALTAALVDLRATADAASGEWWQRALPQERVVHAEQAGHRTLAATVRHQGLLLDRDADRTTEDARP